MICVITALKEEASILTGRLRAPKKKVLERFKIWLGKIGREQVVVLTGAMGAELAETAVLKIEKLYHPLLYIKLGTAGAVNTNLQIGDIVVPEKLLKLNLPSEKNEYQQLTLDNLISGSICIDSNLWQTISNIIRMAEPIKSIPSSAEIPTVLNSLTLRNYLFTNLNIWSVDMESYTVMNTARSLNKPAFSIQLLSDYADETTLQEYHKTLSRLREIASEKIIFFISRLLSNLA